MFPRLAALCLFGRLASSLGGGRGAGQRGTAPLSAGAEAASAGLRGAVPFSAGSGVASMGGAFTMARSSVFAQVNVPSSVTDDFVTCSRTGEDFQTKCKAFLSDARYFPTVHAGTANFTFAFLNKVSAAGWCTEAWAQLRNCLNDKRQAASPLEEPCEVALKNVLRYLQPLAAPAHFPDLSKAIGSGGRTKVSLVFWSGAFAESKSWAEASHGELWVQDGTLEGRLLGMVSAFKWPESEDKNSQGVVTTYPHCETVRAGHAARAPAPRASAISPHPHPSSLCFAMPERERPRLDGQAHAQALECGLGHVRGAAQSERQGRRPHGHIFPGKCLRKDRSRGHHG